jgi:hypothetical protein
MTVVFMRVCQNFALYVHCLIFEAYRKHHYCEVLTCETKRWSLFPADIRNLDPPHAKYKCRPRPSEPTVPNNLAVYQWTLRNPRTYVMPLCNIHNKVEFDYELVDNLYLLFQLTWFVQLKWMKIKKKSNKMALLYSILLFPASCSTCFGWNSHPSSGAQLKCIYSIWCL